MAAARGEFAAFQRAFEAEYAMLSAKRAELEGRRAAYERERAALSEANGCASDSDVFDLNVVSTAKGVGMIPPSQLPHTPPLARLLFHR